jgi:transcriptional regulator with XRE-family HTH domain
MDIFKKIKKLREEKKITQSEMAESLGISQAAYAKIERPINPEGKKISIEYGKSIAKTLGVSFNELFDVELPSSEEKKLISEIEGLKRRIKELEEQLDDKRRIIEFLSDNDFTLGIAAKIHNAELDEAGLHNRSRDYVNMQFGMGNYSEKDFTEEEKKLFEKPYDVGDKQSQIRYIEKWFEKLNQKKKID